MSKGKEIAKRVSVATMENPGQRVLINGVESNFKQYVLHCSECGRVVYSFDNPALHISDVIKVANDNMKQLLDIATYCPKCGQKLDYALPGIVDGEYQENNKTIIDDTPKTAEPQPQVEPEVKEENKDKQ